MNFKGVFVLNAREIFDQLSQWPHRGCGSEEELEARETLVAALTGEYGVHITDEGFYCPKSYVPFFWYLALGLVAVILLTPFAPVIMLFAGAALLLSHLLYFDWRVSPLVWWGPRKVTANVAASKGAGDRLVILMAHLDSAPSSFAYRPDHVKNFKLSVYMGTGVIGLGTVIPALGSQGIFIPTWISAIVCLMLIGQALVASIDFWRFGYTPGANDNLTGVAVATEVASRLWKNLPANTEVRLLITSGEEAGMLGAQHYWRHHRDELRARDTHILNFDTVGFGNLAIVTESGGFTPVYYDGTIAQTALQLTRLNEKFAHIKPAKHHVGDFDSVWFARDGFSALTIAAYDEEGLMPYIHTMEDKASHVDFKVMDSAVSLGEAVVRTLPPIAQTRG